MKLTNSATILAFLLLAVMVYLSFKTSMPSNITDASTPATEFSSSRALEHLKIISEKPHFVGSPAHEEVRDYLISKLELLGLETHMQEGFTFDKKSRTLAKPKNILARLKGNGSGKALMLLSHYDSAPHSASYGASDAGSGIVAILEAIRAFLATQTVPENDIIILFSDAEEIGLLGAKLFVEEHPWAKDVGLVINFEARGSGGPATMILETNGGNATLVQEFIKANPSHPVATSLMYSVYKLLPNDTDCTIFREEGDIDSFFFAFIDDHFDFHTANDTYENLDRNTMEHQGSNAMALLTHFANVDLNSLKAEQDRVYFNFPIIKMVSYPFSWIVPMILLAFLLLMGIGLYGIFKRKLSLKEISMGFIPLLSSLLVSGLVCFFGWKLLLKIYPHYLEIQHGFTYNGQLYIAAFVALTLAITFRFYGKFRSGKQPENFAIAPLFLWIVINILVAIYLKGAAYFIVPVFFGLLSVFLLIRLENPNWGIFVALAAPAIFILASLVQYFPVGLGLGMLVISGVFTVLIFGLLIPLLASFSLKNTFSFIFLLLGVILMIVAHFQSSFSDKRQKPNSLVYFHNADTEQNYWATYDKNMDAWTKNYLDENPVAASKYLTNASSSKYETGYTFAAEAPQKNIPLPKITLQKDSVAGDFRYVSFTIMPQRTVNKMILYTDTTAGFENFVLNGIPIPQDKNETHVLQNRRNNVLSSYYVSDGDSLQVSYTIGKNDDIPIMLQEISMDLLENDLFSIPPREKNSMPKPFITTDAVINQKTIDINTLNPAVQHLQPEVENESD